MSLAWVLGVNKDVIKVNNDKDIEFFDQDLVNIALEAGRCVGQPKKNYLVLEVAVLNPESRLPFIAFFDSYLMISSRKIELDELFGST